MFAFQKHPHVSIAGEVYILEEALPLATHGQACDPAERLLLCPYLRIQSTSDDDNASWGLPRGGNKHVRRSGYICCEDRNFAGDSITSHPLLRFRENAVYVASGVMLLFFTIIWLSFSGIQSCLGSSLPLKVDTEFAPPDVQRSWAAYTPYFSVKPYAPPPSNCRINQVNILQRHGARFPTSGATKGILAALAKLQSATQYTDPRLDFLRNYTYTLANNGDLVPFGALQSEEAGKVAYSRYSQLISQENLPFVRASSGIRVVNSATNWTSGFSIASEHVFNAEVSLILSESSNDTLDDSMCPNAGSSDPQTDTWTAIYGAPIAARLNGQALGSNMTAADISNLIPLCPFESVTKEKTSPFCAIFTADDFAQFEYFGDLDKFYGTGYGQALGPVQGVGYVNELLARLTDTSVNDSTQTNRTLDASPVTFPLNRTVYADFSHDNQMAAIYAALGLFKQPQPLDPTFPSPKRTWITSHLTPFSARMVTERLECNSAGRNLGAGAYVRILVNDALQPLEFCGGDQDGLCTLDAFVESQVFSRQNGAGDFEKCFN